jgi:crotonobetainyl-CoA:carnitine CoA-transferase CaiB-like acyl-CoA transferase
VVLTGGALQGLLVVAVEQAVAAPLCTLRLAAAGARVIKIERRGGDTARHYDSAVGGTSAYFAWLNRGKESVVLDLKGGADLALLERMLSRADVFVQNLAPGAAARIGLDASSLTRRHPRLVAVDIVGFGQDTALASNKAYDLIVQAESGLCAVTGTAAAPAKVGVSVADLATGTTAHALVLEALLARERTGLGRALEVSMFDCVADWMAVPLLHFEHAGRSTARFGMEHASICPYGPVQCSDGEVIVVVQSPDEWQRFCRQLLQQPELAVRPEFATNEQRVRHRARLHDEIAPLFAALTCAELTQRLEAAGLPYGRVTAVADLGAHPALRRLRARLPGGATFELPRPAGGSAEDLRPVPALDADGAHLRAEFAAELPH